MNDSKFTAVFLALFLLFSSVALAQKISSKQDSLQYALGVLIVNDLKAAGIEMPDFDKVLKTVKEVSQSDDYVFSVDVAKEIVESFKVEHQKKMGRDFLERNKKRAGVKTSPSGLQFEILKSSNSKRRPGPNSEVRAHYHGTLIDGTVFDSSIDRDQPFVFFVNRVIKGWQEGIMLMEVGDKYRFYIPEHLAYGAKGAGGRIPPFATLIFDVELLEVISNPVIIATE
jgi:FKBP-type peptidyl-prolyl cis-trans isomerase FklB